MTQRIVLGTAAPYAAAYVIFKQDDKIAFVKRSNTSWMNGYYGLPSGKIEWHESATMAAVREAREETGAVITFDKLKPLLTVHRHDDDCDWIDILFEATDWEGKLHNAEPHIHSELAWLDPQALPENIIPSVRYYIEQIHAGTTYAEYGWPESS